MKGSNVNKTIAAVATPPGDGGVAIIRISGPRAISIADSIFSGNIKNFISHKAYYGKIFSLTGDVLDEVLLLPMRTPRSFTGEDVVEIHCHGGRLITQRVLARVLEAGALPAGPGEFSMRAYLNGKLDLAQAEAIQELICAKNELALSSAQEQLDGALSKKIRGFQKEIADVTAIIEAWVDYPEEGLEFASEEEILEQLKNVQEKIHSLRESFHDGKILHEGVKLCLLGAPNVGKSSLMNALLNRNRAIVTEIAGTTRDLIEESLRIGDLHVHLTDTAGIREDAERIEEEGIRRSKKAAEHADFILFVLDATRAITSAEEELLASLPNERTIVLHNKIDLAEKKSPSYLSVSAKTEEGLSELKKLLHNRIWKNGRPGKEQIAITKERHYFALKQTEELLDTVASGLREGISPEFLSSDLRRALKELGSIIGIDVTEEILGSIFSKFCVGK
ncbi:MAG: tRNA uridine-5-carboxymethylaminomethyl(34) synthesis GTPase MnmE [Candidatus Algichlamydia australiensis]|nr:tRNA uridine-5-carboxymethylaminomethyl(34) synthesis GTPase MnmE [Chlamydiales bacterium]